jgi:hypothetical protein
LALSVGVFAWLLALTSYRNFFYDEWDFITQYRPSQSTSVLLPHNEHWSTIPILLWKLLFLLFGIRSHIPYEAVALAGHVACVLLLFALIRRRSGDLPAFSAALILLVLGTGATNIVWAFQVAWTLTIAFGLLALLLLDSNLPFRWRVPAVSAALLCALMSQGGIGLGFLIAVAVELIFDRRRRPLLLALAIPVAAYGVWFVLYGAGLPGTPGAPCPTCEPTGLGGDLRHTAINVAYIQKVIVFVATVLGASSAGVLGLMGAAGVPVLIVTAALLAWHWYRRGQIESWEAGLLAALIGQFMLIALTRVRFGLGAASDPHYIYVGVIYLLPLIANAVKDLPWRRWWRPALAAVFALALVGNVTELRHQALIQTDLMLTENAELQTAEAFRGAPDMAVDGSLDSAIMPQLRTRDYFALIDELGSPVPRATVDTLRTLPVEAVDAEMLNLFGGALSANADSSRSNVGLQCQAVEPSQGSTLDFRVPSGQWVVLEPTKAGNILLSLSYLNPPAIRPLRQVTVQAAKPVWIHVPDTGKGADWRLRIQTAATNIVSVCSTAAIHLNLTPNNVYRAEATSFTFGNGWSSVSDTSASGGRAAKVSAGTGPSSGAFGTEFVPAPGQYEIWYRVRVTSNSGTTPQIILTLTDVSANVYTASTTFKPSHANTTYSWLLVASNVIPTSGHRVRFQINVSGALSTDWYVDEAMMVPAGSPPP